MKRSASASSSVPAGSAHLVPRRPQSGQDNPANASPLTGHTVPTSRRPHRPVMIGSGITGTPARPQHRRAAVEHHVAGTASLRSGRGSCGRWGDAVDIDAVGLDGTRGGWAVVCLSGGSFVRGYVADSFGEVLAADPGATVAVDMPVGLEDVACRAADAAARRLLTGGASSVFNCPPRVVIEALERDPGLVYRDALAIAVAATGSGFSIQTWSIAPRILEIHRCRPFSQPVHEVHPEVSFRALRGGGPLPRKKSWAGQHERRRLLAAAGLDLPEDLGPLGACPADDVLDAAVAAWTAAGPGLGAPLVPHPADPPLDGDRPVAIWTRPADGA